MSRAGFEIASAQLPFSQGSGDPVGFVVDDAIVVTWKMYRNMKGASKKMSSLFGIAISVAAAFAGSYLVDFIIDKMKEIRQ